MKKRLLFLFACSIALNGLLSAQIRFEQLLGINSCWQDKEIYFQTADKSALPASEHLSEPELVTSHLQLVLAYLQNNPPRGFTDAQLKNRANSLSILNGYIRRGVFPKNRYHSARTPYFIDDSGIACAVGHLMIQTGQDQVAEVVRQHDNYAYIMDLAPEYPQLAEWAATQGFTLEELAWIQPAYGCFHGECAPNTQRNVSCKGGFDGCIGLQSPSPAVASPYVFTFYYKTQTSAWQQMPELCDLWAGEFKTVISGSNGVTEEYIHTITEPAEALVITPLVMNDTGNCMGLISLVITGGIPPYSVAWDNGMQGQNIFPLCSGEYLATVTDNNGCQKLKSATVDLISANHTPADAAAVRIYPNPVKNVLYVDHSGNAPVLYRIYDLLGREMRSVQLKPGLNDIDLGHFPAGNYIFSADGMRRILISKL